MLSSDYVERLFYLLSFLQVATGLYLVWHALLWLNYVRKCLRTDPGFYSPHVALLCPCKGNEPGLERNLISLTEFERQNYEIFFVLASEKDAARTVIERVSRSSRVKCNVVIAGVPAQCGEKVNNLRVAIEQLPAEFEVIAFCDSDGRPGRAWLHHLVAPLADPEIGATTTMRWFIPNKLNFATAMLAAWNAPVVTMLGEKGRNFCWGGGTAIRRTILEQSGVTEDWRHSVSDDYSLTSALERLGKPIVFIPECLTPSYVETNFDGLMDFTNRQILITRVYAERIWRAAMLTHLLYCLTILIGLTVILSDFVAQRPVFHLVTLAMLPLLLSAIRGAIRLLGVTEAMPSLSAQVNSQGWIYVLLPAFVPFLYFANFVNSLLTRKIRWRGISYELLGPNQTRLLGR
jgi:cellulose synthase/poly-beta-1,6-N-acetylglucosamine synthase-like glycosyltransferase